MTDHIETPDPADGFAPVRTPADLERLWRELMGELGFASPQIWTVLLREGRLMQPVKLDELPLRPSDDAAERIGLFVDMLCGLQGGIECAFLYARPGGAARTTGDLAWARLLAPHSPWPVHLANDRDLAVVAGDDLTATAGRRA